MARTMADINNPNMKFFAINKNQAAVLTTLLVLLFLGAGYFFLYLPNNENRIREQRFMALRNIDRNVHIKIENSVALLNNLLSAYQRSKGRGRDSLVDYIRGYSTNNFKLTLPVEKKLALPGVKRDSLDRDSTYQIQVNNDTREISLSFSKFGVAPNSDTIVYRMGMKLTFAQFIVFLLPKDVFDDYVIFSKGRPVYESFPSGISYAITDSLLAANSGIGGSGVKNQVISGISYKLFLQPVGFDAKNEWIIGGLLSSKHYQKEKTELPSQMIFLLATIMLMCMLAFPWLKLYQMGSKERLTISDGIASIFISMLLVSLIFFVFFNYNTLFRPPVKNDAKFNLSEGIHLALKKEIDTAYLKLQQLDGLVDSTRRDMVNFNKQSISYANGDTAISFKKDILAVTSGINVNQVFWLNQQGDEIINWAADYLNSPHGNFKNRHYFKRVAERQDYRLGDTGNRRYFLEQVISWTSGTFRTVLSMQSRLSTPDSIVVAALSFNVKSFDKVVLPTGFLFAVTDAGGNVLYHSTPSRNLNENLLDVFSKSNKLKSCLAAGATGEFATRYYGNEYQVSVTPVRGLPYFIVLFENADFQETMDMEVYSFTFSMLFIFFGFLVIQLLAIFLVSAKRSFFKKQLMNTSWIGPKRSSHSEYVLSAVFNAIIIVVLVIFFDRVSILLYLFMLFFSVSYIPVFLNISFARRYRSEKRNIFRFKRLAKYCLFAFIGIIVISAANMLSVIHFFGLLGYMLLLVLLGEGLYYNRKPVFRMAKKLKGSNRFTLFFGKWNYINSFAIMSLTRLIITSGIPVVFFYIISYNYEQNLGLRHKQLNFINRLMTKHPVKPAQAVITALPAPPGVYYDGNQVYQVSYVSPQRVHTEFKQPVYNTEEKATLALLRVFRLYRSERGVESEKLYVTATPDNVYLFNHLLNDAIYQNKGTVSYGKTQLPDRFIRVQSVNLNYQYPNLFSGNWFNGGVFWLLLVIAMVIFYFIVTNIVKKLFAFNLPDLETWKQLDHEILVNNDSMQPIFVIGLPGSGKKKYLLDKINSGEITAEGGTPFYYNALHKEKNNVFIAELINIPSSGSEARDEANWSKYTGQVFDPRHRMIIVNHFEYNIHDPVSNRCKLEFLERLFLESKCRIIILSTIHPVAFLDSAMEHVATPDTKSMPGQDLERWHVLLGHYRIVVLPLQLRSSGVLQMAVKGNVIDKVSGKAVTDVVVSIVGTNLEATTRMDGSFILPEQPLPFEMLASLRGYKTTACTITEYSELANIVIEEGPSNRWAKMVRQETNHTYFLTKLQTPAFEAGKALPEEVKLAKFDELAFKLQVSSHYFYMYIWQSLTKEEKFLLYDLAEDNLVNAFDDYNLSMLIAKGLVIRPDGTLKLFNKGFRNFILSAIGNGEAMKIKRQISENGNWNTLKYPLQLVILAILAFLLTSQEEAFAKLITYAAALGAGVPAVLKIFTLFDKSSTKST